MLRLGILQSGKEKGGLFYRVPGTIKQAALFQLRGNIVVDHVVNKSLISTTVGKKTKLNRYIIPPS